MGVGFPDKDGVSASCSGAILKALGPHTTLLKEGRRWQL